MITHKDRLTQELTKIRLHLIDYNELMDYSLEEIRKANPGVLESIERGEMPEGFIGPGDEGF